MRPELPETLSDITMRLLLRERGERFKSAVEVRDALPPSRHGSEDLAALVNELVQARRANSEPSSEEQRTTEQFRRRIGDTLWGEANDGHTVEAPIPTPILIDPEILIQVIDSAPVPSQPSRRTERAPAQPAIESLPRANQPDDAAQADHVPSPPRPAREPSPPRPAREPRPGRKVALVLSAVAALIVCAVLGERALRHDRPSDHVTAPSATPEQPDELARGDAPQAPETPRDSTSDQVTRAKRRAPLEPLDKAPATEDPTPARRPRPRHTAQRTRPPGPRTAAVEDESPATSDKRHVDRPDPGNGVTASRSWADGMDDPSAVNPVERFTVSTGGPLVGELIMDYEHDGR